MKLSKTKPPRSLSFNMTPMIDIVFLLIIFFMTVSQITKTADLPIPLPRVVEGDIPGQTATVTINLDRLGNIFIGGERLSLNQALATIEKQLSKFGNDHHRMKITLRCDRNCECRHVSVILKRLANLGFQNVRSAVSNS